MARKIPSWEHELWSYVGSGDAAHCPLSGHCQFRLSGGWCPDDNKERLRKELRTKPSECNFVRPARCRIIQLVERLANRWLVVAKVRRPPVPKVIVWLADERHPIGVDQLSLKACHGAVWRLRNRWVIQLNDDDTSARNRFTLFHEAFHIAAHCKTTPVFRKTETSGGSFNELLADQFAACILMPRSWVEEQWKVTENLNKMVAIFQVTNPAMCIRLRQLGLVR